MIVRSLLSTPGNQAHMLAKASGYPADALMFDLEDSVPEAQKPAARGLVRQRLDEIAGSASVYVRVNGWTSGLLMEDLEAVVSTNLQAIVMPKVETPNSVIQADRWIAELESRARIPAGQTKLVLALETARGVWFAYELLSASPRVRAVLVGTAEGGDLQADLNSGWSVAGPELLYARSRVVLAARALGITDILDGAYSNIRDQAGLAADSRLARSLGYRGRLVIHPGQLATVNEVFAPSQEELELSRRILEAFEAAQAERRGATVVDGLMIDQAMASRAVALLRGATGGSERE